MKQDEFYQALADVPAVPDTIFPGIEKNIARQHRAARVRWAIAASLIAAIGITGYISLHTPTAPVRVASQTLSDETIAELQTLNNFVNGTAVEEEVEQYTLVNMEQF